MELGCEGREQTPWAKSVRNCDDLLQRSDGLRSFLEDQGVEDTNNAAERALGQTVIQRKINHGVQFANVANCHSQLITETTTLRQQGRDTWAFQACS